MIVRQGDIGTELKFQIRKGSTPVNLLGATITFVGRRYDGTLFGGACTITDTGAGRCKYVLQTLDTSIPGVHQFNLVISFSGVQVATLPRYGSERFEVLPLLTLEPRINIFFYVIGILG